MRQKTIFALAAAALLAAASCQREAGPSAVGGEGVLRLALSVPSSATRAGEAVEDTHAEASVHRVDVFAFDRATGVVAESVEAVEGGVDDIMSVELRVPRRPMDIRVVANAPAGLQSTVTTKASLEAAATRFTDNAAGSFVMTGSADDVDPEAVSTLPVTLERVACKVVLRKMTKAFVSDYLQGKDVRLKDVRLVNVRRETGLFSVPDPAPAAEDASYINPRSFAETGTGMVGAAGLDYEVTARGTALGEGIALYFYPNAAAEAASAGEEDYVTKLVLTVEIGGTPYLYPVGLPQQPSARGRNLAYVIGNVTLTLPGNDGDDSPNKYIDKASAAATLEVLDWTELPVDPAFVLERPVFTVDGIDAFTSASGTKTVTVASRSTDMIGRSTALGWGADVSLDGGVTFTETFPAWLTPSAVSGNGPSDTFTLSWDKSRMGGVRCDQVVIRFTQQTTGRIVVRHMKES